MKKQRKLFHFGKCSQNGSPITGDHTNCLFITARNIQHLGSVFFSGNSTCWSYKMCEIYLSDKIYESLHEKKIFVVVVVVVKS